MSRALMAAMSSIMKNQWFLRLDRYIDTTLHRTKQGTHLFALSSTRIFFLCYTKASTMVSVIETIPVEIWERILSFATASALLPFTDDGKLASSLVDTLDLFLFDCRDVMRYQNDTQKTVERLRLVCRAWSNILRLTTSELAHVDMSTIYCPSERAAKYAIRLHLGLFCICKCRVGEKKRCMIPEQRVSSGFDENHLLQLFNPKLRILFWHPRHTEKLDLPMHVLDNVRALSIYASTMPTSLSLNGIALSAPHLTHLHLLITKDESHILSEVVECRSLTYLCLRICLYDEYEPQAFIGWTFPKFRTLSMSGTLPIKHQVDLNIFLSRHGNTITGLDTNDFLFLKPFHMDFFPQTGPYLWNLCPNINTIGIGRSAIKRIRQLLGMLGKLQDVSVPRLTFLVYTEDDYWSWENALEDIESLIGIKDAWDLDKVIYAVPWEEQRMTQPRGENRAWHDKSLKVRSEKTSETFERLGFPIVDRNDVALADIAQKFLSLLETTNLTNLYDDC
jgi:hypothetical protein